MANEVYNFNIGGVDHAVADAVARQGVAAVFGRVSYDGVSHRINFYGKDDTAMSTILGYIDASPFIIDGMVSGVSVNDGVLTITFNTDAGKQPISVDLGDAFAADNYYTKAQTDTALAGKVDKVTGKGLSTNDYTDAEKTKLANLATVATSGSYNDLSDKPTIPTVDSTPTQNSTNAVQSGGVYTALAGKQATISNLATIRTGAAAGATALQPADVSVEAPATPDGTVTINVGDNAYSINLNHSHPQYLKYQLLADEAAYTALATKDSGTLYLIPVTT